MQERWVPMKVAVRKFGLRATKLSRWAARGLIQVAVHPLDKRIRLVDLVELQGKITVLNSISTSEEESAMQNHRYLLQENQQNVQEEWVMMTVAAEKLNIKRKKISRLASRGVIQTRKNPLDTRVRLVNLNELRLLFNEFGSRLGNDKGENYDTL